MIVADARGRYHFRHALLREVVHDDLLPGERAELHLALARALERQAEDDGRGRADHRRHRPPLPVGRRPARGARRPRCAPPTPPSACTPTARRRRCSSARSTCGRASPTPRRRRAATATRCCGARAARCSTTAPTGAPRRCCAARWTTSTRPPTRGGRRPARAALARAVVARARVGVARLDRRARSRCCPTTTTARSARGSSRGRRRRAMLQGRYREALPAAEVAIGAARHADADGAAGRRAQRDGRLAILLGEVEDGERAACARRSRSRRAASSAPARWANLADALHLVGRSAGGRWPPPSRGSPTPRARAASATGCRSRLLEIRWALGELGAGARRAAAGDKRHVGDDARLRRDAARRRSRSPTATTTRRARSLERAADVDPGLARAAVPRLVRLAARRARAPLRRPRRRRAPRSTTALDAIEFCSEDLARIALLSETGAAIEADAAAARPRPRRRGREREAISRAELFVARAEACADDVRPVEIARLRDRPRAPGRARAASADPALDAAAAERVARGRAPVPGGDRAAAPRRDAGRRAASATTRPPSSPTCSPPPTSSAPPWLRAEAEGLAGRARLPLPDRADEAPAPEARGRGPVRADAARAPGARAASPTARRTARSARSSSWPRRPRACTCRASSPSSTCAAGPRRPPWRTASVSERCG